MFHVPECYRFFTGLLASDSADGNNGAFLLPDPKRRLWVIASDGMGWEHVSVHAEQGARTRTPSWDEMCRVKDAFWDAEDVVIQFHPRHSQYVNNHPHALHLWRPIGVELPEPPSICVGTQEGMGI